MSQNSAIGWTDATWNPVTGCSHVSPGCVNCYAEALSLRFGRSTKPWTAQNAPENVKLHPERLRDPLTWRTPKRVFVNSMSDLFHELVPRAFLDDCFGVMAKAHAHTFQILTKRADRMLEYFSRPDTGRLFPNVWLGVSVEDQRRADERIPLLLRTPAVVRFISAEPLLAPVSFRWAAWHDWKRGQSVGHLDGLRGIHWIIVGGESGANHRPMEVAWAEEIAAQCAEANVALYVKQDSGPRPGKQGRLSDALWARKEYPVTQ